METQVFRLKSGTPLHIYYDGHIKHQLKALVPCLQFFEPFET